MARIDDDRVNSFRSIVLGYSYVILAGCVSSYCLEHGLSNCFERVFCLGGADCDAHVSCWFG